MARRGRGTARSPQGRSSLSIGVKVALGIALLLSVGAAVWIMASLNGQTPQQQTVTLPSKPPPVFRATVIREYPHDTSAFTQGLAFHQGELFESIGLYGHSALRKVDLETGTVLAERAVDKSIFAEGLAVFDNELYQLSWREGVCLVYDLEMRPLRRYSYETEGWGLTNTDSELIMSDGSDTLYFIHPKTFTVKRKLRVFSIGQKGERQSVPRLNELEFIDGLIWANVWYSDYIAIISPDNGRVVAWLDVGNLYDRRKNTNAEAVPNGIAFEPNSRRLFVTGKLWPTLFEIELPPVRALLQS